MTDHNRRAQYRITEKGLAAIRGEIKAHPDRKRVFVNLTSKGRAAVEKIKQEGCVK